MHATDTPIPSELPDDEGTDALEVTTYKQYVDTLAAIPPLTDSQRSRLQEQGSTALLWQDSLKLVLYIIRTTRSAMPGYVRLDDMDLIQEGNVAAGRVLPLWNPCRGKLSTWLWPHIRFAMLRYALDEREHDSLRRAHLDDETGAEERAEAQDVPGMEQAEAITLEEQLVYDHHVFDEQEAYAMHEHIRSQLRQLPDGYGDLAADFLFRDMTVADLADKYDVSVQTVYNRLRKLRMLDI